MSVARTILMDMFGCPRGLLGRLGGIVMARTNAEFGARVSELLEIGPDDTVLEVGFGPGVIVQHLAKLATAGHVVGIDYSRAMVEQARARNASAIERGHVDLRLGSVESLPFGDDSVDKALAINSMQIWPNAIAGLAEIRRVMKPRGRIAIGFTPRSRQPNKGLAETLAAAGFAKAHVLEIEGGFCALATKP